jgi:sterol 3beta-glucosyltransferase
MEVSSLKSSVLTNCLIRATTDVLVPLSFAFVTQLMGFVNRVMKERASSIGVRVRAENGVKEAMRALYTYMPRAEDATAARKTVVLSRMQSCASSIQV